MLENLLGSISQQDCVKGLGSLSDQCIDLVFADPPFNIGYDYDEYDDRLEKSTYLDWSKQWMTQVHRVLKDSGSFWLAIGDEYAAELKVAATELGFSMRNWVIWYYTFGVHCHSKFTRSHAHLFYFVKDASQCVFHFPQIAVPSARQLVYNDKRGNPEGRSPDDTWILRPQDCTDGFQADEDIWYFPRVAGTFKERAGFHGCQMPEQLLGRIVRACSNENDIVLDPFSGSSTTLAVAKKLGRQFLGFELSKEYAQQGTKRLESIQVGDVLDGSEEPKASAPSTYRHLKNPSVRERTLWESALNAQSQLIVEAFSQTHRGFSVDRVVADPVLNEDFQLCSQRLGVEGTSGERNRLLFRLRKSGRLSAVGKETTATTKIDWNDLDPFLHACEIAWQRVGGLYNVSLDELLCDSRLAEEFDRCAMQIAPGHSSLEYRWGAIKLRKEVGVRRKNLREAAPKLKSLFKQSCIAMQDLNTSDIASEAGVYSLSIEDSKQPLYVGETQNLKKRLSGLIDHDASSWMSCDPSQITIQMLVAPLNCRLSNQMTLLQACKGSQWNCKQFYESPTPAVV